MLVPSYQEWIPFGEGSREHGYEERGREGGSW